MMFTILAGCGNMLNEQYYGETYRLLWAWLWKVRCEDCDAERWQCSGANWMVSRLPQTWSTVWDAVWTAQRHRFAASCAKLENADLAEKLRKAFAEWIDNGHNDFNDVNTIILCVGLTDGLLLSHGTRYEFWFSNSLICSHNDECYQNSFTTL